MSTNIWTVIAIYLVISESIAFGPWLGSARQNTPYCQQGVNDMHWCHHLNIGDILFWGLIGLIALPLQMLYYILLAILFIFNTQIA